MKTVSKSKLKNNLFETLRLVELEGEELIVTDQGKPVVKITQYVNTSSTKELFGKMRGGVQYFKDLTMPTTQEWPEV